MQVEKVNNEWDATFHLIDLPTEEIKKQQNEGIKYAMFLLKRIIDNENTKN